MILIRNNHCKNSRNSITNTKNSNNTNRNSNCNSAGLKAKVPGWKPRKKAVNFTWRISCRDQLLGLSLGILFESTQKNGLRGPLKLLFCEPTCVGLVELWQPHMLRSDAKLPSTVQLPLSDWPRASKPSMD